MNGELIADFLKSRQASRKVEAEKRKDRLARQARLKDWPARRLEGYHNRLYRASARIGDALLAAEASPQLGEVSEDIKGRDHIIHSRLLVVSMGEILVMRSTVGTKGALRVYNLVGAEDTLDYLASASPAAPPVDLKRAVDAESSYDTFRTVYAATGLPQVGNLPNVPAAEAA